MTKVLLIVPVGLGLLCVGAKDCAMGTANVAAPADDDEKAIITTYHAGCMSSEHCYPGNEFARHIPCSDKERILSTCAMDTDEHTDVIAVNGVRVYMPCESAIGNGGHTRACRSVCAAMACDLADILPGGCSDKNGSLFWANLSGAHISCQAQFGGLGHYEVVACVEDTMEYLCAMDHGWEEGMNLYQGDLFE